MSRFRDLPLDWSLFSDNLKKQTLLSYHYLNVLHLVGNNPDIKEIMQWFWKAKSEYDYSGKFIHRYKGNYYNYIATRIDFLFERAIARGFPSFSYILRENGYDPLAFRRHTNWPSTFTELEDLKLFINLDRLQFNKSIFDYSDDNYYQKLREIVMTELNEESKANKNISFRWEDELKLMDSLPSLVMEIELLSNHLVKHLKKHETSFNIHLIDYSNFSRLLPGIELSVYMNVTSEFLSSCYLCLEMAVHDIMLISGHPAYKNEYLGIFSVTIDGLEKGCIFITSPNVIKCSPFMVKYFREIGLTLKNASILYKTPMKFISLDALWI